MTSDSWDEVPLREIPAGVSNIGITGDGRHVYWYEPGDDGVRFVWDDNAGKPFDSVEARPDDDWFYSPRRDRIAFWGVRGEDTFVVVDGVEYGPYDAYSRDVPPTFSVDGLRVAYGISPRGVFESTGALPVHLIVDGSMHAGHQIAPVAAVFSPDGSRVAHVGESTEPRQHRWAVVNGEHGPDFDGVSLLTFSPDSRHFAYAGTRDARSSVIVDGRAGPTADDVAFLTFSQDGSRFAYALVDRGRTSIVADFEPGPWHDHASFPVFSRTNRLAYMAGDEKGSAGDRRRRARPGLCRDRQYGRARLQRVAPWLQLQSRWPALRISWDRDWGRRRAFPAIAPRLPPR